jgi:hypothetical protein
MAQRQAKTLTISPEQPRLRASDGATDADATPTPSVTRKVPTDAIRIDRLMLHYLDHQTGVCQLVDVEPQLDQPELSDLVHGRYAQYLSYAEQNADWTAEFDDTDRTVPLHCLALLRDTERFVDVSQQLALRLYDAMLLGPTNIVPGDLVVIIYHTERTPGDAFVQRVALLKVDPDGKQLSRMLVERNGHIEVEFQRSTNTLPGIDSLQKCALISLSDDGVAAEAQFALRLLDKQAGPASQGVAAFFYRDFLGASLSSSARRRTRLFLKATNAWLDQHAGELSPVEMLRFLQARRSSLRHDRMDLRRFAAMALEGHAESAAGLLAYITEQVFEGNAPLADDLVIQTDQRVLKKLFEKVTLVLDGGLKLSVSAEKFAELVHLSDQRTAEGKLRLAIETLTLREVME